MMPIRDVVIFPHMMTPFIVGRESSVRALEEALAGEKKIFLATQHDASIDDPKPNQIHQVGTIATIVQSVKLPDGNIRVLVEGGERARVVKVDTNEGFMRATVQVMTIKPTPSPQLDAAVQRVTQHFEAYVKSSQNLNYDAMINIVRDTDPARLSDTIAANLQLNIEEKQELLELFDPLDRLTRLGDLLEFEIEKVNVDRSIQSRVKRQMERAQKEFYLNEKMKAIQKELGRGEKSELDELKKKIETSGMSQGVQEKALQELKRLEMMPPMSAESTVSRNYIDWLLAVPWKTRSREVRDMTKAERILEEDHYGLEKIKERILEFLAVRRLVNNPKGSILCFVGPPGVGKTSLGKSIARATGRKFVRLSLGGVRDEAEIRGHRRTYIGALPGKVIQGIKQAGTNNPVFMMDEVDKVGADFRGDPSAALLEVLDPEQNVDFTDHYLGVPFDLRNVMFITTANLADPILPALKDRMEIIEISGYTEEEKLHIVNRYIRPRQLDDHGISKKHLEITDEAILKVIQSYTREAGLRNLEREIATICRKVARDVAEGKKGLMRVTGAGLHRFLGAPKFLPEPEQERDEVGVATGLAWTQTGGDILYIECTMMRGKGNLSLTGHLGEVMKESAQAAMSYARSRGASLGIKEETFAKHDIHIHVPAGAIPKDGPSAGITMATALISTLTKMPVRRDVAMTGEITLRGKVLPIGGLKEKALAARRMGIKTVIVPTKNDKDVKELPANVRRGMQFVYVDDMDQVLKGALVKRGAARRTPAVSTERRVAARA